MDSHSSGICVATYLERPTREHARTARSTKVEVPLFGLAPSGVYHAVECYHRRGALLPHHFTLTCFLPLTISHKKTGGLFSAALAVGSRLPGVTWHSVLWSPDFPPCTVNYAARLPGRLPGVKYSIYLSLGKCQRSK